MNVDRPARKVRLPWKNREAILPADDETMVSRRVPLIGHLPLSLKNHFVAMMGEFAGTFLFLLFALGGTNVVNAAPEQGQPVDLAANPAKLLFISLCFGMSLAVNAWVFFRISGGLFNPAVSFGRPTVADIQHQSQADTEPGHVGNDDCRCSSLCERLSYYRSTNPRGYRFGSGSFVSFTRTSQRAYIFGRRYVCGTRTIHRGI